MDEHGLRKMLEGGGGGGGTLLRAALRLPGLAYGGLMRLRRLAYEAGVLRSGRAAVPVISVGNLTAGGAGKTPTAMLVCRVILALGKRPGIILRGYRSEGGISDEAELYRRQVSEAVVAEGADRLDAAARAVAGGAEALVVDDGFQHLRLRRDLDIVLVDALSPWGGGVCFPGGLLREPRGTLNRAGAVVVTRSDQCASTRLEGLQEEIRRFAPNAALFVGRHRPVRLLKANGESGPALEWLKGKAVVAVCGIARPEAFALTLSGLGAEVVELMTVADHRGFDRDFADRVREVAERRGAAVIVTEKDAAKKSFGNFSSVVDKKNGGLLILGVDQEIDNPEEFERLISGVIGQG